jgi:NTE family protein
MAAALLPAGDWPRQQPPITAVDAESGHRATFGPDPGAGLLDAVAASGALPGVFPLVTIGGRRYADGGVHSLYNADLAAGHDVVTVLTPPALNDYFRAAFDVEVAALGTARRSAADRGPGIAGRDRIQPDGHRSRASGSGRGHGPGPGGTQTGPLHPR